MISSKSTNDAQIRERQQQVTELMQMARDTGDLIASEAHAVGYQHFAFENGIGFHDIRAMKEAQHAAKKSCEDLGRLINALEFQQQEIRKLVCSGLPSDLGEIAKVLFATFPFLPAQCSVKHDWVWNAGAAVEGGYAEMSDDLVGVIGLEDASFLFEEADLDLYEGLEMLQTSFEAHGLQMELEPYYSFLWVIRRVK